MKILNLQAENIKRIKAVDITPKENVVVIAGKNGEGKSSVLDSIFWALAGTKNIQDKPIRDGEEKASIRLDLGKYVVERRFKGENSVLEVRSAEGAKFSGPQAMLDALTASITFDPLEFARMESDEQYEALRGLLKMEVDIDALDKANKADFDVRTDVNRQAKAALAEYEGMKARLPAEVPAAKIDVVAVSGEINAHKDKLREVSALADRIVNGTSIVAQGKAELKDFLEKNEISYANEMEAEKKRREDWDLNFKTRKEVDIQTAVKKTGTVQLQENALQELIRQSKEAIAPTPEEIKALEDQLADANRVNAAFDLSVTVTEKKTAYAALHTRSEALTAAMKERDDKKAEAIAGAKMPIAGLSLAAGRVVFGGIPFDQASSAEQIKVSTSIAMAMNPELRVIRIKDGALLDDDSMNILRTMAAKYDFQIWIERVGGDQVGIIIEDGQVKS